MTPNAPNGTILLTEFAGRIGISTDYLYRIIRRSDGFSPAKKFRNIAYYFDDEADIFIEELALGVKKQKGRRRKRL